MERVVIARRLTILCLLMAIFAFAFAALVEKMPRPIERVHIGSNAPCFHPATPGCTSTL